MPQDGSNNYYYPPGTPGVTDQTIESEAYNTFLDDLVANDLNIARPVHRGGTGATAADAALTNLTAEKANQIVTNYDSHVFLAGSFMSNAGATSAPTPGEGYAGTALVPAPTYTTIEATNMGTGAKWVRQKVAGVWGAWVAQAPGLVAADARYVNVTGDTMTGDLTVGAVGGATNVLRVTGSSAANDGAMLSLLREGAVEWYMAPVGTGLYLGAAPTPPYTDATTISDADFSFSNAGAFTADNIVLTGGVTAGGSIVATGGITSNSTVQGNGLTSTNGAQINMPTPTNGIVYLGNLGTKYIYYDAAFLRINGDTFHYSHAYFSGTTTNYWSTGGVIEVTSNGIKPGGGDWAAASDARIKTVLGDYTQGLAAIKQLTPRRYVYKGNSTVLDLPPPAPPDSVELDPVRAAKQREPLKIERGKPHPQSGNYQVAVEEKEFIGLVAQEAEVPMPEMVTQIVGRIDGEPVSDLRILDTTALVYALVNAVKELSARVEELENPT